MARARLLALAMLAFACAHTDPGEDDSPDGRRYDARPAGDGARSDVDAIVPKPDAAETPDSQPVPDAVLPTADAPTMLCGSAGPDLCAAAQDLTAGASAAGGVTVTGDTSLLSDDLAPLAITCTGFLPDGPDAVYKVTAGAGRHITAEVTPMDWDISVYIASACDSDSCVAGADDVLDGEAEIVAYTVTTAGTYYIVVDGWDPTAFGCYQLTVSVD